ncbi:1-deoxy-D-xylulose-5-phosphate reductoisomerase [Reinekea blandensis]|uniref:1-deoxy-D-xylulose 5-phosphate reductoisomerase n=1 Tax=Reinekea blandensis MED297 TaxID=314283 RepID=A4BCG2_9GAMM|nr:1-deoxy-D-xylulose-5-phosphate reductoisomerase [Reinekea blandensis]EAR10228.1 1-deoxy-D-xylulose 5-phosphate reductoisomerase [Reinekea sp. MED297] [Reinekea blandensis MED297]
MATSVQNITILGATGSIGQNTLDVIHRHPERYRVHALSGHSNMTQLARDVDRFAPDVVIVPTAERRKELLDRLSRPAPEIRTGEQALVDVAGSSDADAVMAAIVGAAGLESSIAAARAGRKLLLANKESLVVAGRLLMEAVQAGGATLLPIDSEHNAIFQCLPEGRVQSGVESVLLTASGGPFRDASMEQLIHVTPDQAVAHPNWSMGRKISVDSATLMNKGLELIEACWLFGLQPSDIEVVIHPQSVIHSMVRYVDGSVIAQMGAPDMRTPIAYGLAYPERIASGSDRLAFNELLSLNFDQPDRERFPCLRLAEEAFDAGGTAPAILNAANEETVAAFLEGYIGFTDIGRINEAVLCETEHQQVHSVEQLRAVDQMARECCRSLVAKFGV